MEASKSVAAGAEESQYLPGKLSVATLKCDPKKVKKLQTEKAKLPLARLFGKAQDTRVSEDKATGGTHTFFVGTFEGINLQTGIVMRASRIVLPHGISERVEKALEEAKAQDEKRGGGSSSITFAFEIVAVKDSATELGYSYEAQMLRKPEPEDELAELRRALGPAHAAAPAAAKKAS